MKDIKSLIKLHEGERLRPYKDTVGKWTIGIGRNLDDVGISPEESALMFENDLRRVTQEIDRHFPWAKKLNAPRYAALVDMLFNLGLGRLRGFRKFLAAMEKGDWDKAAYEMQDSLWWRQVKTRARRLQQMVLTGRWPSQ